MKKDIQNAPSEIRTKSYAIINGERFYIRKQYNIPRKTFKQIQEEWDRIQTLDSKNKAKNFPALCFDINRNYCKDSITTEQTELYILILKAAIKSPISFMRSFPKKLLVKFISIYQELTGNNKMKILNKANVRVNINSGTIVIIDDTICEPVLDSLLRNHCSSECIIELMNQKQWFVFGIGGDGYGIPVQVRVIDSTEPMLTTEEFVYVEEVSEISAIHVPSGNLVVSDIWCYKDRRAPVPFKLEQGTYKLCVYLMRKSRLYVVLCKTDEKVRLHFTDIPYINL